MAIAANALKPSIGIDRRADRAVSSMYARVEASTALGRRRCRRYRRQEPGELHPADRSALVDDVLLVGEGDIEQAIVMLLEVEKTVVEGAGAVRLAALLAHPTRFAAGKVGMVLSGGNIDPLVLAVIIERGMVRAGRVGRASGGHS